MSCCHTSPDRDSTPPQAPAWRTAFLRPLGATLSALLLFLGATHTPVQAHQAPQTKAARPHPLAEILTHDLVELGARYHLASPAEQAQLLPALRATADERQQLLRSLIADNPGEVLRVALPDEKRAALPPSVRSLVEETVALEGDLEVLHEDLPVNSRFHYFLHATGKRFALHFAAEPPTDVLTGARVRVAGVRLDQTLALDSGDTSVQALTSVLPNTFGEQRTLMILVNFSDNATQPYTLATAQNVVFNQTHNFDLENSYGQTWLSGTVVGWYTIALSSTVCDYSTLASQAKAAAQNAGVNLGAYTRYVYGFPQNACTWWGLGTVGGNPSQSWINGTLAMKVVAHEMGHNYGLYHSHSMDCGTTVIGTSCTTSDYGDTLDTMGSSSGHYNAFQKELLGWLDYGNSPTITTVTTTGVYNIEPLAAGGTGAKGLAILKSTDATTGQQTWYYIELRQAIGVDSFLSTNSNVLNGVVVHTGAPANRNSSYLLDMTPGTTSWSDPALVVGQSFTDPAVSVTITPLSVSSTSASVSITFGPQPCVRANPTVTISPSQSQWVQAGATVPFTVAVTNNDNTSCTASTFALQATVPGNWTSVFANNSLVLNPGQNASTTLQVTLPAAVADGFYPVQVSATNAAASAYTASTTATVVVATTINATVTTNQPSYRRNKPATITTTVTSSNGNPVANANVTITVTKANGSVVTQNAVTGSNGVAVTTLQIKRNDPLGTYQVRSNAALNGLSASATTSFIVQ